MRTASAAIVLSLWAALGMGRGPGPTPPVEEWIGQEGIRARLQEMVRAGMGRANDTEIAGFAVRHPDGTVTLERWPDRFARSRQTFRGRIPAGAIALVHTHPAGRSPVPSEEDAQAASATKLPVIALSRFSIWVIEPGARQPRPLVTRRYWLADGRALARPPLAVE